MNIWRQNADRTRVQLSMVQRATQTSLPGIDDLQKRAIALAVLEAVLSPDWESRTFLFDPRWSQTEQMAKQTNGSGNDLFIVFAPAGVFLLGFDHESEMSPWSAAERRVWPGVLSQVPSVFAPMVDEPAFDTANSTTFCLWREAEDEQWHSGLISYPNDDASADGSEGMLAPYVQGLEWYLTYASEYYESTVDAAAVAAIFSFKPLEQSMVLALRQDSDWASVRTEAQSFGYPVLG